MVHLSRPALRAAPSMMFALVEGANSSRILAVGMLVAAGGLDEE